MTREEIEILTEYFPKEAVKPVSNIIVRYGIHFRISRSRRTKLGDYRPPINQPHHKISVNHDLNQYAFLITFIHEVAHLIVYKKYKNRISAPHGFEWKNEYRELMQQFINLDIFPEDIKTEIVKSLVNSKATSSSELELIRVLRKYDKQKTAGVVHLEDLPEGSFFIIQTGRRFEKGAKRRVRYLCRNIDNQQLYLFHPLTEVKPFNPYETTT
jgi:hypothetical protein